MAHPMTVLALSQGTGGPFFGEVLSGLTREVSAVGGPVVVVGQGERCVEAVDPRARDHDRLAGVAQVLQIGAPDGDRDRDYTVDLGPGDGR